MPVFHIETTDSHGRRELEFDLTRFFKIAHEYSVGDMRDRDAGHGQPPVARGESLPPGLVEALFGHIHDRDDVFGPAQEGEDDAVRPADVAAQGTGGLRLRVSAATRTGQGNQASRATVMGAPRASLAPFYPRGGHKDWSAGPRDQWPGANRLGFGDHAGIGGGVAAWD